MGYLEDNLMPGEKIIYKATPHWVLFIGPVIILCLAIILLIMGVATDFSTIVLCAFILILGMGIYAVLLAGIAYFTTEFGLTDKRVIAKDGLIRRRSVELLLSQVESIGVNQPVMGRILNYGTITVVGTGGTKEPFKAIPSPLELRKRVHLQISQTGANRQ